MTTTKETTAGKPFYYGTIRNVVGAFGALFSNIKIERRIGDSVKGKKKQIVKVPCEFAPKEKWYNALTADPTRDKQVAYTLPRLSFEILGLSYDSTRKTTRSMNITCTTEDGIKRVMNPAPWNLELALYVVSNKIEDVLQIIEQILPTFNPDYTMNIRTVEELDLVTPVPISLTSIGVQDDYQGDFTSHRVVIYTLTFTAKMNIYGQVLTSPMITEVDINLDADGKDIFYGNTKTGEITYKHVSNLVEDEDTVPAKEES